MGEQSFMQNKEEELEFGPIADLLDHVVRASLWADFLPGSAEKKFQASCQIDGGKDQVWAEHWSVVLEDLGGLGNCEDLLDFVGRPAVRIICFETSSKERGTFLQVESAGKMKFNGYLIDNAQDFAKDHHVKRRPVIIHCAFQKLKRLCKLIREYSKVKYDFKCHNCQLFSNYFLMMLGVKGKDVQFSDVVTVLGMKKHEKNEEYRETICNINELIDESEKESVEIHDINQELLPLEEYEIADSRRKKILKALGIKPTLYPPPMMICNIL